jgi:hypothetical protein
MTIDTILTALNDWAAARNITIVATRRDLPPAELDMRALLKPSEADSAGAGLHVYIDAVANRCPEAYIGFWIPNSLKKGSWSAMHEDDDEIPLHWILDFNDEASLIAFIDRTTDKFLLQHVYEASLDEWFADQDLAYEVVEKKEFCGDAATLAGQVGLWDWLFVEFKDPAGYDITLGISGKGEASTFYTDEEGFLTFELRGQGFKTGADLTAWLEFILSSKS